MTDFHRRQQQKMHMHHRKLNVVDRMLEIMGERIDAHVELGRAMEETMKHESLRGQRKIKDAKKHTVTVTIDMVKAHTRKTHELADELIDVLENDIQKVFDDWKKVLCCRSCNNPK